MPSRSAPQGGKAAVIRQTSSYWGITPRDEGLADALKALVAAVQPPKESEQSAPEDPVSTAYPVGVVSEALEREEALLAHLNESCDYYRSIVFMSLPVQTQIDLLRSAGSDFPGIDLRPVDATGHVSRFRSWSSRSRYAGTSSRSRRPTVSSIRTAGSATSCCRPPASISKHGYPTATPASHTSAASEALK